jgi:hypothetical protein
MYLQGLGFPGLHLIFLKFGHRGEYGKVRSGVCIRYWSTLHFTTSCEAAN